MLSRLVHASLSFRWVVVVAASVLLALGVATALETPLDVFPEFAPPLVEIQTEAPGLSSETVENIITIPLENAVNGVPQMTTIRSKSVQGLSSIQLLFERGTDILRARQMVTERVAVAAANLPQRARTPKVLPPLSSTSRILKVGFTSRKISQTDVSVLVEWVVLPRLQAVPGVSNISVYGMKPRQYEILVKPEDLRSNQVTLDQIKQAAQQAVAYGSAGFVDTPNQRLAVQYASKIEKPEDLAKAVVVQRGEQSLRLGQVATLTTGSPPAIGEGVINDEPGLLMVIEKYPDANTLEVTRKLEAVIETLRPGLPDVEFSTTIFRPATFIEQALANLRVAMIAGCILVALIIIAFLFEWRSALISLTAIPLSLVTALFVLSRLGGTINTMVLAGLAIAIGEVVDDAIIDVENIVRRLRLNRLQAKPHSAFRVVLDASLEVRSAVVYASFIVVFVCVPILFMGGVAEAFFRPLALAYILSVLASLVVALTITPALALILLPPTARKHGDAPLVRATKWFYRRILAVALARPVVVLLATLLLFAVGIASFFVGLKEQYLPRFQESDFLLHWIAKPGTGIDFMREDIIRVSKELRRETAVKQFGSHIARAEIGEEVVGPNFAELWISLGQDVENYDAARQKIEAVTARHAGIEHDLLTYLQERIKEVLSGAGASVVIRTYGPDLAVLRRKGEQIRTAIADIADADGQPALADLRVESQVLVPQVELLLDPDRLDHYGLTAARVVDAVTTLLNGAKVGQIHQDQKTFDLVVRGHPDILKTWPDLKQLDLDLPSQQGTVRLGAVAQIRLVNAPNVVRHDKASRCIDVLCNLRGSDLKSVTAEIKRRLEPLQQEGYRFELLGEYQARAENQRKLLLLGGLAVLGIAVLLYMDFRSLLLTVIVLLTLPFALIGSVAAVWLTGGVVSLGSLVGFVTVLGIAARNGIMMMSHYRHLQLQEGVPFGRQLIVQGAEERVSPVLMTALAAGLGLLPLAISGNQPGYEVEYPMAVVILGGLATSTLLNLVVLPVVYSLVGRFVPVRAPTEEPAGASTDGDCKLPTTPRIVEVAT
jgi:CzcA family heavy metal efflux pump